MQQIRHDFRSFKRFGILFAACILCLMFWNNNFNSQIRLDYDELIDEDKDPGDYCENELFAYKHVSIVNFNKVIQKGRPFNCSKMSYLKKFNLTKQDEIKGVIPTSYPKDMVFVSGADVTYFQSIKASFATVRRHFGSKNKFILYDLGGLAKHHGPEIAKMCNVELRTFDFNQLPENVRYIKSFSWKILILAEVFNQYKDIIYLDSSIYFDSGDYEVMFRMMSRGFRLVPFQMSGYTSHSVEYATHQEMYTYLPFDLNTPRNIDMMEANLLLLHRSESTRQLLKWAVLCATTLECIDPPGSVLMCDRSRKKEPHVCNRQDQSVFSILMYNMEADFRRFGFPTISHIDKKHPKTKSRHQVLRNQLPNTLIKLTCEDKNTQ